MTDTFDDSENARELSDQTLDRVPLDQIDEAAVLRRHEKRNREFGLVTRKAIKQVPAVTERPTFKMINVWFTVAVCLLILVLIMGWHFLVWLSQLPTDSIP